MDLRLFGCLDHFVVGRSDAAIADIFHHRAGKQPDVLLHDTDVCAKRGKREGTDILPINQDVPGIRLIKAGNEVTQRAFSAAGRADERRRLSCAHMQADVPQHAHPLVVGKGNVLHPHVAAHIPQRLRTRRVGDVGFDREQLLKADKPGHADSILLHKVRQPANRLQKSADIERKGQQIDGAEPFEHNHESAEGDHRHIHQAGEKVHAGLKNTHLAIKALFRHTVAVVALIKFFHFIRLVAKRFGHPYAGNA